MTYARRRRRTSLKSSSSSSSSSSLLSSSLLPRPSSTRTRSHTQIITDRVPQRDMTIIWFIQIGVFAS
eukprot:843525-Pyramimonas_sp.AAC.1